MGSKSKLAFYSLILAAIAAGFIYRARIYEYFRPALEEKIAEFEKAAVDALIKELKEQIKVAPEKVEAPPPLRAPTAAVPAAPAAELTVSGVVDQTNIARAAGGLPRLSLSAKLNAAATLRLEDMFAKQYFAHVSPSGEGVESAAKVVGYEYIVIGENLALGNFSGDKDLVAAWMASPGHRANILNPKYTEIGVALRKGVFEGEPTWIAAQIFARPLSYCPSPDSALKAKAEFLQSDLEERQKDLEARRAAIESAEPKYGPEYARMVDEYNALVAEYNRKLEELKAIIAKYNAEVAEFNLCVRQ